jgi:hypothetical protein
LAALTRVIHTPQASGIPTKAQNTAAFASSPPNPIPCEPVEMALFALAACSYNVYIQPRLATFQLHVVVTSSAKIDMSGHAFDAVKLIARDSGSQNTEKP